MVFKKLSRKISEFMILFYVNNLGKRKRGNKDILSCVSYHLIKEHSTQIVYILAASTY